MNQKRHPAITTIAVLNFVFGGLWLLCGTCILSALAGGDFFKDLQKTAAKQQGAQGQKQLEFQDEIERLSMEKNPHQKEIQGVLSGMNILFGIVLIVAGFGMLKVRPWARWVTLGYGIADVLLGVLHVIWTFVVDLPAQGEVSREIMAKAQGENKQLVESMMYWTQYAVPSQIGMILFGLLYPLLVLVVLCWPSVAAAFRGEGKLPTEEPDDLRPEDRWRV